VNINFGFVIVEVVNLTEFNDGTEWKAAVSLQDMEAKSRVLPEGISVRLYQTA
jgi:hypothetical protein